VRARERAERPSSPAQISITEYGHGVELVQGMARSVFGPRLRLSIPHFDPVRTSLGWVLPMVADKQSSARSKPLITNATSVELRGERGAALREPERLRHPRQFVGERTQRKSSGTHRVGELLAFSLVEPGLIRKSLGSQIGMLL
jgi:hypothetical protein